MPSRVATWRESGVTRQQGVCVYPVKGAPDAELRFARMPRWMGKAHLFDLDAEWPTFSRPSAQRLRPAAGPVHGAGPAGEEGLAPLCHTFAPNPPDRSQ